MFSLAVPDIKMRPGAVKIGYAVALELKPVDYVRQRFGFLSGFLGRLLRQVRRRLVSYRQQHALAIGRPFEIRNTLVDRSVLAGVSATPVKQPDLGFCVIPAPGSQESEVAIVRAPSRRTRGLVSECQLHRLAAVSGHHVEMGYRAVVLPVHRLDRIGDPASVGTEPGIGHILKRKQVIDCRRSGSRLGV